MDQDEACISQFVLVLHSKKNIQTKDYDIKVIPFQNLENNQLNKETIPL
jgi:uncharacterized protein YueI